MRESTVEVGLARSLLCPAVGKVTKRAGLIVIMPPLITEGSSVERRVRTWSKKGCLLCCLEKMLRYANRKRAASNLEDAVAFD